ncbi:hypothetical protein IQ07DRAFT_566371 [Pyrenochaeta sp. DS3sAY3a]|nr:hypothetical protein IQ07DRAFT_566371 [Pyrenochaeta sp. DS3sAY3a]
MPQFLHPSKHTQHRVAAIALYRALLSRCTSAPLADDDQAALRNAIRHKFRKNRKIQSPYQLGLSFKAGYETLDHLDASSSGDRTSTSILTKTIAELPRALTRAPTARPLPVPKQPDPERERQAGLPPKRAVLNARPYPVIAGPRHVPILASANGVPFLRLTKPQPRMLTRIIRQRLERRQVIFDTKVFLNNWWKPMCQSEDAWDDLLRAQLNEGEEEEKWVDAIHLSLSQNKDAYQQEINRDKWLTKRMQYIVDKETELALKEGRTIVRGRRRKPLKIIKPPLRQRP